MFKPEPNIITVSPGKMPEMLNQLSHKKQTVVRAKPIIQLSDMNLFIFSRMRECFWKMIKTMRKTFI